MYTTSKQLRSFVKTEWFPEKPLTPICVAKKEWSCDGAVGQTQTPLFFWETLKCIFFFNRRPSFVFLKEQPISFLFVCESHFSFDWHISRYLLFRDVFENIDFSLFQVFFIIEISLVTNFLIMLFFFQPTFRSERLPWEEILQDQRYLSQKSSNMGDKDELVQRAKLAEQVEPQSR